MEQHCDLILFSLGAFWLVLEGAVEGVVPVGDSGDGK